MVGRFLRLANSRKYFRENTQNLDSQNIVNRENLYLGILRYFFKCLIIPSILKWIRTTFLYDINNEIKNNNFPDELKLADVTPIFKKGDKTNAKNYRPVSVVPPVSKVFEKILQKQMALHFNNYLISLLMWLQKRILSSTRSPNFD